MWYNIVFWRLSCSLIESFPSLQEVNPAFSPREVTVLSARKSPKITTLFSFMYVFESTIGEIASQIACSAEKQLRSKEIYSFVEPST